MKDIVTVMKFTIKDMVKRKSFIISTLIILILIVIGFNVPNVIKNLNGDISVNPLRDFVEENNEFSSISFVGDSAILYKDLIEKLIFKKYDITVIEEQISTGISIGKIGYTKYKNGEYGDSSFLSPIYLRKSQAELALEEKNGTKYD